MKSIYLIILGIFVSPYAYSDSVTDNLMKNVVVPDTILVKPYGEYKADTDPKYKGRVENRVEERMQLRSSSGSNLSRSVVLNNSESSSQVENLEALSGELVEKLEDDRIKKTKKHRDLFNDNKSELQKTYTTTKNVDYNKLGSEQDPTIQNAFKCKEIEDCNDGDKKSANSTDVRNIDKTCTKQERLHWNGRKWSCEGIFAKISGESCTADQYVQNVNGGVACIDYIYVWKSSGSYGLCDSNQEQSEIIKCYKIKTVSDKNYVEATGKCFGPKPVSKTRSCTANWSVGEWSTCSKSCGGGTQSRNVSCEENHVCSGTKPSESQACNTQSCTTYKPYSSACSSGYTLSGTSCVKSVRVCRKDNNNNFSHVPSGGADGAWRNIVAKWNGVNVKYAEFTSKGFSTSDCRPNSYGYCMADICGDVISTAPVTKKCPAGYVLTTDGSQCYK